MNPNPCHLCNSKPEISFGPLRANSGHVSMYQAVCQCGNCSDYWIGRDAAVKDWNKSNPRPEDLSVVHVTISEAEYWELLVLRQSVVAAIAEMTKVDFAHPGEFGRILEILKYAQNGSKTNH